MNALIAFLMGLIDSFLHGQWWTLAGFQEAESGM